MKQLEQNQKKRSTTIISNKSSNQIKKKATNTLSKKLKPSIINSRTKISSHLILEMVQLKTTFNMRIIMHMIRQILNKMKKDRKQLNSEIRQLYFHISSNLQNPYWQDICIKSITCYQYFNIELLEIIQSSFRKINERELMKIQKVKHRNIFERINFIREINISSYNLSHFHRDSILKKYFFSLMIQIRKVFKQILKRVIIFKPNYPFIFIWEIKISFGRIILFISYTD
ncbi:hypothetical protein ABPG72_019326 [Tetrahymena utriculariae]